MPFETVKQADPTLPKGQTKVLTAGQNGSELADSSVSVVDGQEVRRVVERRSLKDQFHKFCCWDKKMPNQPLNPTSSPAVTAKGTQEEGHVGEAPVQPSYNLYRCGGR